ncbi:LysR family transcriptional regulator [Motilimonas eburnea]|uniref:LysR family transcriptional regulator n=1 Tax=Motilimonas eburnea TaxID=1737488 RepID=UPI001E384544|nr:LysR family transcriptional regulator [Motilimonas eburnea]MCE2573266.1 LysR family transcriptional regulator [Motilimonas eburnea]
MDWNLLHSFLAIARNGSLNGAARELGVNHSTIFRRLNLFEDTLSLRLFDRLPQGYKLTQAGEELLRQAEQIGDAFDALERQFTGQDFRPRGVVRITAPNNIAYHYLPAWLSQFKALYPEIKVELIVGNQDLNLTRREADIAIRATANPPEHLIARKLADINWGIYGAIEFPPVTGFDVNSLRHQPLIGAEGAMANLTAFRWQEQHLKDAIVARANDLNAMAAMAEYGMGLAFLPDDQQNPRLKRLDTLKQGKQSHLWLLLHPDLRKVERVKLLVSHLQRCFSEDPRLSSRGDG